MSTDRFVGGLENIDAELVAGEALSAGDAVEVSNDNEVSQVTANGDPAYGVCMYDAANGDSVAVATTAAKVRVNASTDAGPGPAAAQTDGTVDDAGADDAVLGYITESESGGDAIMTVTAGNGEGNA